MVKKSKKKKTSQKKKKKKKATKQKSSSSQKVSAVSQTELAADKRKTLGRQVKKLRRKEVLPANIYGKDIQSQAVKVSLKKFLKVYKQVGETGIVELKIGKEKQSRPVLIHNIQQDPITNIPIHADFYQVDLSKKVEVSIPIELKGESPAVNKGGVLVHLMDEIEVEALPTELPEKFLVDISSIKKIGQSIAVKDLEVDENQVNLLVEDQEQVIVMVQEPKEEEEVLPPEEELGEELVEGEVETEGVEEAGKSGQAETAGEKEPAQKGAANQEDSQKKAKQS